MHEIKIEIVELGTIVVNDDAIKKYPQDVHRHLSEWVKNTTNNHIVCVGVECTNMVISFKYDAGYTIKISRVDGGRKFTFLKERVVLSKN